MRGKDTILETLNAALKAGAGDEAELVAVVGTRSLSRCANSVIHQSVTSEDAFVVARVVQDGRIGCASTHGLTAESATRVLKQASELASFAPRDSAFRGLPSGSGIPEVRCFVEETAAVTAEDRARSLAGVFEAAGKPGLEIAGAYGTTVQELGVVNTSGVAHYAPLSSAVTNLVALGETSSGYACGMSRDVRDLDFPAMTERAIRKCVDGSNPIEAPAGDYEVILEPAAVAELMEWMTYTCFGARSMEEKTSALADRLGEPIVGTNMTIYDDATDPSGVPTPFDFEGQPKKRLDIITRGIARGFGTDSTWASRLDAKNTSHAMLRGGEEADPVPMNLFIEAGDTPADDLVAGVERGLLVTRFHYVNGFLDTRRALMTGMTRDGTFLIENGTIKGGVGNLRFTQSMVDAFSEVKAISREREVIPVWWSEAANTGALTMPTLHINRFHFTGKTEQ